jgi:hypothetical protein
MSCQFRWLPGTFGEDLLGDIFGAMDVTVDEAQRCGINEVHMSPDEFGEGGLRMFGRVTAQQFSIFAHSVS